MPTCKTRIVVRGLQRAHAAHLDTERAGRVQQREPAGRVQQRESTQQLRRHALGQRGRPSQMPWLCARLSIVANRYQPRFMVGPNQTDLWQVEYKCTLLKKIVRGGAVHGRRPGCRGREMSCEAGNVCQQCWDSSGIDPCVYTCATVCVIDTHHSKFTSTPMAAHAMQLGQNTAMGNCSKLARALHARHFALENTC